MSCKTLRDFEYLKKNYEPEIQKLLNNSKIKREGSKNTIGFKRSLLLNTEIYCKE
jgi:hypothetical protein